LITLLKRFQILALVMKSEKNWTKIVTEDLSLLGGDRMARLRPDIEFRVEEDKTGKVTRFLAHRKIVGALLGPADTEKVVKVKDVAGEAFGALLTFLYQPAVNFDLAVISISSLLQLFSLAHRLSLGILSSKVLDRVKAIPLTTETILTALKAIDGTQGHSQAAMLLHNRLVDHISLHLKQGSELVESLLRHHSSATGEVVVPLERLLKLSTKEKVVSFSSSVEEATFRPNSSLQSKSAKNRRKAEKKRKRMEKRNSESSQDDSGLASSYEDDFSPIIIEDRVSSNVASEESLEEDALMEANLGLIFNMDLPSDRVTMQRGN